MAASNSDSPERFGGFSKHPNNVEVTRRHIQVIHNHRWPSYRVTLRHAFTLCRLILIRVKLLPRQVVKIKSQFPSDDAGVSGEVVPVLTGDSASCEQPAFFCSFAVVFMWGYSPVAVCRCACDMVISPDAVQSEEPVGTSASGGGLVVLAAVLRLSPLLFPPAARLFQRYSEFYLR